MKEVNLKLHDETYKKLQKIIQFEKLDKFGDAAIDMCLSELICMEFFNIKNKELEV